MNIYLAGGMRSEWRDRVKSEVPNHTYFDPADKEANEMNWTLDMFGSWDLHHIRQSDVVFGYMERTNPSGIGMSCEHGYAFGLDVTVILVLEKDHETMKDRYLDFLRKVAHITFDNLEDGIEYLKTFKL